MRRSISLSNSQRSSHPITMTIQEFLDSMIEITCSTKVEAGSMAFKLCNKAIANRIAKYNGKFPLNVSYNGLHLASFVPCGGCGVKLNFDQARCDQTP